MRAGARGYVLKGAEQHEITRAIMAVAAGEAIFGPAVAIRVLAYFATPPATPTPFPELTAREREVLDLLAAGHNNHQIAQQLTLSGKTVANHVSAIFARLQVADRTHKARAVELKTGRWHRDAFKHRCAKVLRRGNRDRRRAPTSVSAGQPRCRGPGWT
jgi:DNA-binding NarL/FixJ family response regulator